MKKKRAQISIEYMIVVAFVTFLVIAILGAGYFYSSNARDRIKFNQLSTFSNSVISTAERIFYAGEPSKATITPYLPPGIRVLEISGNEMVFTVSTSTGVTKISFTSKVELQGSISPSDGIKRLQLAAQPNGVLITEG